MDILDLPVSSGTGEFEEKTEAGTVSFETEEKQKKGKSVKKKAGSFQSFGKPALRSLIHCFLQACPHLSIAPLSNLDTKCQRLSSAKVFRQFWKAAMLSRWLAQDLAKPLRL